MVEETSFCNANFARDHVNILYKEVVDALQMATDLFITKHKNFFTSSGRILNSMY